MKWPHQWVNDFFFFNHSIFRARTIYDRLAQGISAKCSIIHSQIAHLSTMKQLKLMLWEWKVHWNFKMYRNRSEIMVNLVFKEIKPFPHRIDFRLHFFFANLFGKKVKRFFWFFFVFKGMTHFLHQIEHVSLCAIVHVRLKANRI